ncbi:signal peptidase I [Ectobacillus sp. JY-23]|uniref:signal peptidase I SipW n=1 Tax=Ectobacillus sp. JY-23 TaxID=2933872 RepID=UPI001FF2945B|nr:signal peptidase I [Ectobacillus sp. JY-23]UOY94446.1 signal peptidase I [Ectobacillus sp. JY-23]
MTGIIRTVFTLIICALAFVILSSRFSGSDPTLAGYQLKAVLSGSMEPTFQTGSIIAINIKQDPSKYEKGDIITFQIENQLVTHRIVEVLTKGGQVSYKTKGDNNNTVDLWTVSASTVVGQYNGFTIPYVGYALNYATSKVGSALLLFIPGALLFLSAVLSIIASSKRFEVKKHSEIG